MSKSKTNGFKKRNDVDDHEYKKRGLGFHGAKRKGAVITRGELKSILFVEQSPNRELVKKVEGGK